MARSPNRYLIHFGVIGKLDIGRRQVKLDGFPDILLRFFLCLAGRGAAGKFRTYGRVGAGFGVVLQDNPEFHAFII